MNKWWGYVHVNGAKFTKRYFDPDDIKEAEESPFVESVHGPWECLNQEEALQFLEADINGKNNCSK